MDGPAGSASNRYAAPVGRAAAAAFAKEPVMRRRTILGSVIAGALARAVTVVHPVAAQSATPEAAALAAHPIVGAWMVATPAGPSMAVFFADGTNIQGLPAAQTGPF